MKKIFAFLLPFLLFCGAVHAADGFEAVKCGADVPQALIGKKLSNEPVMAIEGRHKDLGLKDLGASEISDNLNSISWQICGNEYMVLEAKDVVRDVIPFPPHSKSAPAFSGGCELKGQKMKEVMVGVLDNSSPGALLSAKQAWKIDEKNAKFVKMPVDGLRCSREGIITADGGK